MCAHVCVLCKGYAENCCLTLPKTYVTANCRNIYSAWPWRQFKFKRNNPQVKSSSRLTGEREEEKRKKERNCNEDKERWELKCIPYIRTYAVYRCKFTVDGLAQFIQLSLVFVMFMYSAHTLTCTHTVVGLLEYVRFNGNIYFHFGFVSNSKLFASSFPWNMHSMPFQRLKQNVYKWVEHTNTQLTKQRTSRRRMRRKKKTLRAREVK